ncbi:PAS domain S-box protein [Marinilabilia salmonicolor]|uniref:PAS domain S-box-containing protein n=2 Tax=Marinilabilia salmonicolor TaxID=989 RepID=A0A368UL96_9BACT|nr:PAS domain S-box protein [Marinilabilia salmonicolor]RCW29516.1 PAS domain S-box-containing protein [Marinilabilia salmonicolor]
MGVYKQIQKTVRKWFFTGVLSVRDQLYLLVFIFLFLLLAWGGFLSIQNRPFSFSNILYLHTWWLVWIVDLLIVAVPLAVLFVRNYINIHTASYRNEIHNLKKQIDHNTELAGKLRDSGEVSEEDNREDQLSSVLLELGKNLRTARLREDEENYISKGKEQMSDLLRTHHALTELTPDVLKALIDYMGGIQGAFYLKEGDLLKRSAMHAYNRRRYEYDEFKIGKGLVGAAAYEKQIIYRTEIPDDFWSVTSGIIGEQKPRALLILPLLQEEELQGVVEIAFMQDHLGKKHLSYAEEVAATIGQTIYNLKITSRTEKLLEESQSLTKTLQENEEQLRENAREMLETQEELEKSNQMLETQVQEVAHAQKRLEALLTNASEFISIYNENQELVFESPSVKRILGYDDDDEVNGMDPDLLTPRGYRTINNLFQYLLETPGGEQTAQYTYLRKNGEKLFLETKGKNLLHDPAIKGIIFNTQDITERKRAEKEEQMKSRMQSLSENSPDMIMRVNMMGKLVYVNPAVAEFVQISANDIVKKRVSELELDTRFVEYVEETLEAIKSEQDTIISEVKIEVAGNERIMEIKGIPELNDEGDLESVLFVSHDMTEFKKIEADIKDKNKKISDSINYAQRIQSSLLPDTNYLQNYFPRSFIFYRPKDVVSGDFPWFLEKDGILYVAAVDCTGHGVPGALLSFIGYFLLNNIVSADPHLSSAEIMEQLHQEVRKALKQDQEGSNGRDGMDIAFCKVEKDKKILDYCGAHRPLFLVREGELLEYQGTRKGIGGAPLPRKKEKEFENHVIDYQEGDKIFIFSDGLPDQLGGPDRKKFQPRRMREALTMDASYTMAHYGRYFPKVFYEWMGEEKQVDDVLLIGIEL